MTFWLFLTSVRNLIRTKQCVCTLWCCFLPIFWGREFGYTLETSTINTILLSHQWSEFVASRLCLVTETTYYLHIALALRLPGITTGYCLRIFAFCVQCLNHCWGFHNQALLLQGQFEFHKGLKVIRCCFGSPGKSGEAHQHLVVSLGQSFVVKFKLHSCLHSFQECFSWQTKFRINDWNNSISD